MNKFFKTILLTTIIIFLGFSSGCTNKDLSARNRIRDLTDISIPDNSEMVYNQEENYFMNGVLPQYTVFSFDEEPTEFLSENIFQEGRNESFEEDFNREFESYASARSDNDSVPNEYRVIWENQYFYLASDIEKVLFVYIPNNQLLIVFICGR